MGALFMKSPNVKANESFGDKCQKLLQPEFIKSPKAIKFQIQKLTKLLIQIKSMDDLLIGVSDPSIDLRGKVFFVEGFGPVLNQFDKKSEIAKQGKDIVSKNIKVIEDAIGKHNEKDELIEAAKAIQFDDNFVSYLQGQSRDSLVRLYSLLETEHWIGEEEKVINKMANVYESLSDLDWPDSKAKDNKQFFAAMKKLFGSYNTKMNEEMRPLLEKVRWEYMENMEEGLHEVRRLFRWVMIIMQMRPELFSYSKPPELAKLIDLPPAALEIAKKSLNGALTKKSKTGSSAMLDFGVNQVGTMVLSPEIVFYISGLVDELALPKRKSEMYFNMQREIRAYLKLGKTLGGLTTVSTDKEIQEFIITASSAGGEKYNLQGVFVAGSEDPFAETRLKTLELLNDFWNTFPLVEFQDSADEAKDYWKSKKPKK